MLINKQNFGKKPVSATAAIPPAASVAPKTSDGIAGSSGNSNLPLDPFNPPDIGMIDGIIGHREG